MVASFPKRASGVTPRGALPTGACALDALREATRAAHAALEETSPLLRDDVTREVYAAYLASISPLVAAAEAFALASAAQLPHLQYDFAAVARHPKLQADLASLRNLESGAAAPSFKARVVRVQQLFVPGAQVLLPAAVRLPEGAQDAGATSDAPAEPGAYTRALEAHAGLGGRLGVLYVLEGSTLGGQVLCRQLGARLQLQPHQLSYLAGYGRATGARWRATCALLEAALTTPAARAQAGAAAAATFRLFGRAVAAARQPV